MATPQRTLDQHIAVFGESGSGKTVLLSSFYGPALEGKYASELWDLVADDTTQGNRLYKNYVGMRDRATAPSPTRFAAATYYFSIRLKTGDKSSAKRRPIDVLRLGWHDYPGEWFEESPSSPEEAERRVAAFRGLLRADVGILLVDGQKLLDHQGEEERYLKSLLTNYRQGLLRLKPDVLDGHETLVEFPRIWILALSKADLFPDWNVETFRDLVIGYAAEHLEALGDVLRSFATAPEVFSIGEDFLLLSSAKFALSTAADGTDSIDVTKRVGLELLLPIASMFPLERRAEFERRMQIPRKVLDGFADGFAAISTVLAVAKRIGVAKLVARFPKLGPAIVAMEPVIDNGLKVGGEQLRQMNQEARERQDVLTATLTQFRLDLERGVAEKHLIRSPK